MEDLMNFNFQSFYFLNCNYSIVKVNDCSIITSKRLQTLKDLTISKQKKYLISSQNNQAKTSNLLTLI